MCHLLDFPSPGVSSTEFRLSDNLSDIGSFFLFAFALEVLEVLEVLAPQDGAREDGQVNTYLVVA